MEFDELFTRLSAPADESEQPELLKSRHAARLLRRLQKQPEASLRSLGSEERVLAEAIDSGPVDIKVIIVANTLLYRHLALTRVAASDRVVEIGAAHGHCTALFRCPALGVDLASGIVEEAQHLHPDCHFVRGDVLSDDITFLDTTATVLFLDIGGNRSYKPVMKALAVCMAVMPCLRLVVAKSIEARRFLVRSQNSIHMVARDLAETKDDDVEAVEHLAGEVRRRGGELPIEMIPLLSFGHRMRFLVGQKRVFSLIRKSAPLLEVVEVASGPPELRERIRAAPGPLPARPAILPDLAWKLQDKVCKQLPPDGGQFGFREVFARLRRSNLNSFVAAAADPELHWQASDPRLDPRAPEPWSNDWQAMVAMRHLFVFLRDTPAFVLHGSIVGPVPTTEELFALNVSQVAGTATVVTATDEQVPHNEDDASGMITPRPRLLLQILTSGWGTDEESPEVKDLVSERAWLLEGGQVLQELCAANMDVREDP